LCFRPLRGLRVSQFSTLFISGKQLLSFRPLRGLRVSQWA